MPSQIEIRFAGEEDISLIFSFLHEFAEYTKCLDHFVATPEMLRDGLFGPKPYAEALISSWEGRPAGVAIFFHNYSTFLGKPGIYLEDLYVKPEMRGNGIGTALLRSVAEIAVDRGCGRFDWSVLDWNESSIAFYRRLGAVPLDDSTLYRLEGEALALAASLK